MSLYCDYMKNEENCYYQPGISNPFSNFNDPQESFNFIEDYFSAGSKRNVFTLDFERSFRKDGKHQHTVALYYLGCKLFSLVDSTLRGFLKENLCSIDWYDFKYIWFLSCLYHDTASSIEHTSYSKQELDFFLGANCITHNVFRHKSMLPYSQLFTFPEKLVENYFNYRIDFHRSVDHGILGGYLLFDRLKKNYDDAWRKRSRENHKNGNPEMCNEKYENFEYNNRNWQIDHLDLFAIIADSIIAHNIWFSDDSALYDHYGLTHLLISPANKITLHDRPLLFFLSLLDTIEPVKCLTRRGYKLIPVDALKSVSVGIGPSDNLITITGCSTAIKYDKWFQNVKKAEDWLNIEVSILSTRKCNILIK